MTTKFILDSGDPDEYRDIGKLAKEKGSEIWGSTTNPTLIAKKLSDKKLTREEAFALQQQLVMEILDIVPGAVSAEVYADEHTTGDDMTKQGIEIATWDPRVVVKLPTTHAGFEARTNLRKEKIPVNNTLIFSQEQIFAICLHEQIMQKQFGPITNDWPPFISPFVGRLDDIGENGMALVEHGMQLKKEFHFTCWMLEASVRTPAHIKRGIEIQSELLTAPAKAYRDWFALSSGEQDMIDTKPNPALQTPSYWHPSPELLEIATADAFISAINSGQLNIQHPLTDKGLVRFAADWQAILRS